MDKIIIYQVCRYYYTNAKRRNDTYCANAREESYLYTSKNKAIDRARSLATLVHDYSVNAYYKAYEEGSAKTYQDIMISVDEYHEFEGKLNFADRHHLLETCQGKVHRYEDKDIFFQSL